MSGGSAANTMCGVASFGGRAAYIGKVSRRRPRRGVRPRPAAPSASPFRPGAPEAETPTGRCIIVVTPDAQRTMNTYLGVSSAAVARRPRRGRPIAAGAVLYMEGYLFDRDDAKEAFRTGRRRRPRQRPQGVADAVGLVLRRPPPRRLPRPRARRGRHPVRQRATSCARCTRSPRSTTPSPRVRDECELAAITGGQGRLGRRHRRRRGAGPGRTGRPGSSTRRAPATSTPPASCTATRTAWSLAECGRLGLDRRRRGDQPRRSAAPRRAAYPVAVTAAAPRRTARSDRRAVAGRRARRRRPRRAGRRCSTAPPTSSRARFDGPPAVRHGRPARRDRRRPAADEPARRAPGGRAASPTYVLASSTPTPRERGVVIGYDARRKSDVFAARHGARDGRGRACRCDAAAGAAADAGAGVGVTELGARPA